MNERLEANVKVSLEIRKEGPTTNIKWFIKLCLLRYSLALPVIKFRKRRSAKRHSTTCHLHMVLDIFTTRPWRYSTTWPSLLFSLHVFLSLTSVFRSSPLLMPFSLLTHPSVYSLFSCISFLHHHVPQKVLPWWNSNCFWQSVLGLHSLNNQGFLLRPYFQHLAYCILFALKNVYWT